MQLKANVLALAGLLLIGHGALAGARATSFLKMSNKAEGTYAPANLIDEDPETVWIEGSKGPGLEESFEIDLPLCTVKAVHIFPGHSASERMYKKYAHLKEVSLSWFTIDDTRKKKPVKQQNFIFQEKFAVQTISVEGVKLGEELFGGQLKVTIRSVFPGIDFQDTAVGGITVELEEFPAQQALDVAAPALKGFSTAHLVDGNPSTAWAPQPDSEKPLIVLKAPDFGLSAIQFTSGAGGDPKTFHGYARPKEVSVEIDGRTTSFILKDQPETQRFALPPVNGFTGALYGTVRITIDSVYPGKLHQSPAIREIQLMATNYAI